ncbi:cysteine hydrolase family protein [Methylibium sp. T29]|uniref:cysteine hydrolase family protein n=1 Tax=Methylibium sp. T29 TaxID=1430884 RepID=UPI0009DDCC2A|nr:cysteine hydrolase family protein [Methylibium sp. T29]
MPNESFVDAEPYPWPYDGDLRPDNTALIVIDMQTDFCGVGGYVDKMGYDLALTRAPIEPIKRLMARLRTLASTSSTPAKPPPRPRRPAGQQALALAPCRHRRRGHRRRRPLRPHPGARRAGLGNHPRAGTTARRAGDRQARQGSFYATDLDMLLRVRGIRNLLLAGITTDVCVHTTMRDANDRGYECLLLSDCTAATDPSNHLAALHMVKMQGGVFGAVASSTAVLETLA